MNDVVIRAAGLSKTYRLYSKPHFRFLDMFGLLRRAGAYQEHHALNGINLTIRRGEKVALIGRNGAGKSTLLKLVTGVSQPSAGILEVSQGAHALLQIGTGFYPEFTGRQNALAYLAHLGVSGVVADRKVLEIIDFAELEEYIDQPVKTYSSGMMARLMFATSTAIEPELLILDEILGVGDAYFSNKSYERIREMCAGGRTTVLLVSHDIYSAQKLSDRMIWIDQGRILLDDVPEVVVRGYEDSIRVQEEARLRKKVRLALQRQQRETLPIYLELRSPDGRPLPAPAWFSRLALSDGSDELAVLSWDGSTVRAEAIDEGSSWGDEEDRFGQRGRWMAAHGVFRKVAVRFDAARSSLRDAIRDGRLALEVLARADQEITLLGEIEVEGRCYKLSPLVIPPQGSEGIRLLVMDEPDSTDSAGRVNTTGQQGSGAVLIETVRLLDTHGKETFWVRHGASAAFLLDYRIVAPTLSEYCDVCIVFFRAGTRENVCRILTRDLRFEASRPRGTIRLDIDRVVLGTGRYSVWVFIAKKGYLTSQQHLFYSVNPDVYLSQPDVLEFEVSGDLIATNTAFVGDGRWSQA